MVIWEYGTNGVQIVIAGLIAGAGRPRALFDVADPRYRWHLTLTFGKVPGPTPRLPE